MSDTKSGLGILSNKRGAIIRTALIVLIMLAAAALRFGSVLDTGLEPGVRNDATDYFYYAYNLKYFGVYSRTHTFGVPGSVQPLPDAVRPPGYSLFLYPFINRNPSAHSLLTILLAQALISVLTVAVAYRLYRIFLPTPGALGAALLTALSPHLVTMNIYLLSETWFCFLAVSALWAGSQIPTSSRPNVAAFVTGALLSLASLTRPGLQYYVAPFMVLVALSCPGRRSLKLAALVLLGFGVVYAPWVIRNIHTLGTWSQPSLMINAIADGMYPQFMYHGNPSSYGIPYRFDPNYLAITRSLHAALTAVWVAFHNHPWKYLYWYLLDKPIFLWSWNIIAGAGDVFIYPVLSTPYLHVWFFHTTHAIMWALHWPLVLFALFSCIWLWTAGARQVMTPRALFTARSFALMLLYWTAVLMITAPYPRYAVPLRPFEFGLSVLAVGRLVKQLVVTSTDS